MKKFATVVNNNKVIVLLCAVILIFSQPAPSYASPPGAGPELTLTNALYTNGVSPDVPFTFTLTNTTTSNTWTGTITGEGAVSWSPATTGLPHGEYTLTSAATTDFEITNVAGGPGSYSSSTKAYRFLVGDGTANIGLTATHSAKSIVASFSATIAAPEGLLSGFGNNATFALRCMDGTAGGRVMATASASAPGTISWEPVSPFTIAQINSLAVGSYVVEETDTGFNSAFLSITGTVAGTAIDPANISGQSIAFEVHGDTSSVVISITNQVKVGEVLTINSIFNGQLVSSYDTFRFQIRVGSNPITINPSWVTGATLADSNTTIVITGAGWAAIQGLDIGVTYSLVEVLPAYSNYRFSGYASTSGMVTITGGGSGNNFTFVRPGTAAIDVTNENKQSSGSQVTVATVGPNNVNDPDFIIRLTPSVTTFPTVDVTIKAGATQSVADLVYGVQYIVTEVNVPAGYDSNYAVAIVRGGGTTGTGSVFTLLESSPTAAITVTNRFQTSGAQMTLRKTTNANGLTIAANRFSFTLTHSSGATWTGTVGGGTNTTVDWSPALSNLPYGEYTLVEAADSDFDLQSITSQTPGFGSYPAGTNNTYTFTINENTTASNLTLTATNQPKVFANKEIVLHKTLTSITNSDLLSDAPATLTVLNGGTKIAEVTVNSTDSSKWIWTTGDASTLTGLLAGSYTVTETQTGANLDLNGITITNGSGVNITTGTAITLPVANVLVTSSTPDTVNITFENKAKSGQTSDAVLTIHKTLSSGSELASATDAFDFQIFQGSSTSPIALNSGNVQVTSSTTVSVVGGNTIRIIGTGSATVTGLPYGIEYVVKEIISASPNYSLAGYSGSGGIPVQPADGYAFVASSENLTIHAIATNTRINNAGLVSVAGQTITASGDGTATANPKSASISVLYNVSQIALTDIVAATGANATMYSDAGFNTSVSTINLTAGTDADLYIKVVALDGTTTLYYKVTTTRAPEIYSISNGFPIVTDKSATNISAKIDADYSVFYHSGTLLGSVQNITKSEMLTPIAHYTHGSGSTIITLTPAYLSTLAVGTYQIRVNFAGGSYTLLSLVVSAPVGSTSGGSGNSKTSDDAPLGLFISLIAVAGAVLIIRRRLARN